MKQPKMRQLETLLIQMKNNHLMKPHEHIDYVFFGSSRLSVLVLEQLITHGYPPRAIVTTPDTPKGRKLIPTPTETKVFGSAHHIPVLEYTTLKETAASDLQRTYGDCPLFIVASYGLLIPQQILDIPQHGIINIHPSLLPMYRGAIPIQQAILDDRFDTGITIMQMDKQMDHGDILLQEKRKNICDWPKTYPELEHELALQSSLALISILPSLAQGQILGIPQDHAKATFTKKISKQDGCIDISQLQYAEGRKNFLKYCAFYTWPGTFFMVNKGDTEIRVKITHATWDAETQLMRIERVIPEGQKEVAYHDFLERMNRYY